MAGRGRGMTLPAWMTEQTSSSSHTSPPASSSYGGGGYGGYAPSNGNDGRYDNSAYDPYGGGVGNINPPYGTAAPGYGGVDDRHQRSSRNRSRSRDRDDRSHRKRSSDRGSSKRERSRSKEKRKERSPSPDDGKKWVSRRKGKSSNFDVRPADGQVLPPIVGLGTNLNPGVKLAADGSIIAPGNSLINMQATRHARRLYVGGIPPSSSEEDIGHFFRTIITQSVSARELDGKDPIVSVFINREKSFAFVELQTIELTTACCKLDGMTYCGNTLRIRRPNDYQPERILAQELGPIPTLSLSALGVVSTTVHDGPNKVFIGNLPPELGEDEIKELLSAFGPLKAFHLVKESGSSLSKGYAFCEYLNPSTTNIAIMGLNNLPVCDKILNVKLASQNVTPVLPSGGAATVASIYGPNSGSGYNSASAPDMNPTRVLLLKNLVDKRELYDDNEYHDILDDVKTECSQHGSVRKVLIPRHKDGYPASTEGSVFVEFNEIESSKRALQSLKGRKFADRMVLADYYDEIKFSNRVLA